MTEIAEAYGVLQKVLALPPGATQLPFGGPLAGINADLLLKRLWVNSQQPQLRTAQLAAVARAAAAVPTDLVSSVHDRRRAAVQALAARRAGHAWRSLLITPRWRLIIGHGDDTASETGLTMSSVHGVPIVPATALKGVAAAQARAEFGPAMTPDLIRIFGSPRPEVTDTAVRGSVVLLDALPVAAPTLVVDVLTPHVQEYYTITNGIPAGPPAEYHNPVPVRFLAVTAKTVFRAFAVGPTGDLDLLLPLLRRAVDDQGLGGKTAAGYGYCSIEPEDE